MGRQLYKLIHLERLAENEYINTRDLNNNLGKINLEICFSHSRFSVLVYRQSMRWSLKKWIFGFGGWANHNIDF